MATNFIDKIGIFEAHTILNVSMSCTHLVSSGAVNSKVPFAHFCTCVTSISANADGPRDAA